MCIKEKSFVIIILFFKKTSVEKEKVLIMLWIDHLENYMMWTLAHCGHWLSRN